jgi:hypothetical protein
MQKIKAPAVMIETAKRIHKSERKQACRLMEKKFIETLKTLTLWDDYTHEQNIEMAAEAAAAEALYRFA